jgi:nicotinamide phosphoribosyltransferase
MTNVNSLLLNAMLLTDGYKLGHKLMYPTGLTKLYSNLTPRSNKHFQDATEGAVVFGIQYFVKKYLVDEFNNNFFNRPEETVVEEYDKLLCNFLGRETAKMIGTDHIRALHKLGYLPIRIKALEEGTYCPMGVPMLTITNTHRDFAWLTNYLETLLSNALWKPINSATTADVFKRELMRHAIKTGFYDSRNPQNLGFLCHDFSMRGMSGVEDAIVSGMGHLTSWNGSETVPAVVAANYYYNSGYNCAGTIPATEHSIECANAVSEDGTPNDEAYFAEMLKRFPNGYISIVSDGFDYWNVIENIVPKYKKEIMGRNGRVVIRPDSGDPVDIICGLNSNPNYEFMDTMGGYLYRTKGSNEEWSKCTIGEYYGTYEYLYIVFGGTINKQGYRVLDDHIGVIYGDAINMKRQRMIYKRLEDKKFAATNLVLGIGSFTYQCATRDNLGIAMKATYCEIEETFGEVAAIIKKNIFKDPKTVVGMPKKSLRGLITVDYDKDNNIVAIDQVSEQSEKCGLLKPIFENGKILHYVTLDDIRMKLLDGAYNRVMKNNVQ